MKNSSAYAPVTKTFTGIHGFDEITQGRLPRGRSTLVMSGPGCGKTATFAPHQKSGLLKIFATRTRGPNVEDQFDELRRIVMEYNPRCLVIDRLSAMVKKNGRNGAN